MRRIALIGLVALTACGKAAQDNNAPPGARSDLPKPGVAAAPGIALAYEYGFRLPADRIAAAQEDNAAQCEARGPAICRIAGLSYDVGRDRTVRASLDLRLAPEAARAFGKDAINGVVKHGGMLASTRITSEEAGAAAAAARGEGVALGRERAGVETQLKQTGLSGAERSQLQSRLARLADAQRTAQSNEQTAAQKLASTPMTLVYDTGAVDQSLSEGPLLGALKDGGANIVAGTAIIVTLLVSLVPWAVLAGLAIAAWLGMNWLLSRPAKRARRSSTGDPNRSSE